MVQVKRQQGAPMYSYSSEACAANFAWCVVQVDKHKSDASREVHEMQRRVEQEKTQRTCMMR